MAITKRKGFYFSFDAILALVIMSVIMVTVTQTSILASGLQLHETTEFKEMKISAQDALMTGQRNYTNHEIAEQWHNGNQQEANETAQDHYNSIIPERYTYRLEIDGEELYQRGEESEDSSITTSTTAILPTHKTNGDIEGPAQFKLVIWN